MSRKIKRYGWIPDLPDQCEHLYAAPQPLLAKLPKKVGLHPRCPPVFNQRKLGSCTANAIAAAHQFDQMKKYKPKVFPRSRESSLAAQPAARGGSMNRCLFQIIGLWKGRLKNPPLIELLLVTLGTLVVATPSSAQDIEPTVLVRRVVPANFHDPNFDQTKLDELLKSSASRMAVVEQNSNVSSMLKKQYNISKSWTPAVYDKMEAYVLTQNAIRDPQRDIKPGQVLKLPDLPRTAQIYIAQGKADQSQTKNTIAIDWNKQAQAFTGSPKLSANSPSTGANELQVRVLPISALESLQIPGATTSRDALINGHEYQVMQEPMTLTLADAPLVANAVTLLNQSEKASLIEFLSRPAKTKPLVVILDDSFPSQSDFSNAAKFVISASREIRQKFGLMNSTHADSPELISLEKNYSQGTLFCDEDCEYPKLKMHSAMIRESLKEVMELDANKRVEVIYLPVNAAQPFSKDLLAEMLNVALLADSVTDGLVLMAPGIQPPVDLQRGTPDFSNVRFQVEKLLKPRALYSPLIAYQGQPMMSQTDKGVIDGIINFIWLYSMASQRPHFVSMSWTSPNLKYSTLFRNNGYGLWLAAAGNGKGVNVHSALLQFAARSSDPGDVLAVENVTSACENGTFTTNPDVPVFGFAFPGRISSDLCGTSFSTPRIAWFLAAHEAIKGETIKPYTEQWNNWRAIKRIHLMALQKTHKTGEERYAVSPWQLLEEPTPQ